MCYLVTRTACLQLLLQIDNHKEWGNPAEDAELDEMILDETFCRGAAEAENDHILEVTQKAGLYPTTKEVVWRAYLL